MNILLPLLDTKCLTAKGCPSTCITPQLEAQRSISVPAMEPEHKAGGCPYLPLQVHSNTLVVSSNHARILICCDAQSLSFCDPGIIHIPLCLTASESYMVSHKGLCALGLYSTAQHQFPTTLSPQYHIGFPSPWPHKSASAFWLNHAEVFWSHNVHAAFSLSACRHNLHISCLTHMSGGQTSPQLAFVVLFLALSGLVLAQYSHVWFHDLEQLGNQGA